MKALIIGSGKQAVGVAWYLVNHTDFEEIGLYSRSQGPMDNMIDFVGGERVKKHIGNVFDPETLKESKTSLKLIIKRSVRSYLNS